MVASDRRNGSHSRSSSLVQFMVVLDIAIVNVALPSIQADLGFSQENLQWVISAYALVFGGFLLLGGRVADLLGRRRIFFVGLVVFTLGSLLCGLAWSEASLIAARAFQGLGAAIDHAGRAVDPHDDVRRGSRAQHRPRRLGRGRWFRRRGRRAARRRPDRPALAGSGSSSSTSPWALRPRPRAVPAHREPRRARQSFDIPGAVLVTSGSSCSSSGSPRVTLGLGLGRDDRCLHRLGRPARRVPPLGERARTSR